MRVLMVENDLVAAKNLASFFTAQNIRVETAETGEDALDLLRHYEFDIVLLNLCLPDMDGSRVIARMRTARLDVPVLALSDRTQARLSVDAVRNHMSEANRSQCIGKACWSAADAEVPGSSRFAE